MASFKQHAKGWRAFVCINYQRESAMFRTKREAEIWASRRETEIRSGANLSASEKYTLAQTIERYRDEVSPTKRGHNWEFLRLNAFLRDKVLPINKPLTHCTSDAIGKYRDSRLQLVAKSTVLRELGLLSSMLEEARREWKWIESNPVKDVRKPRAPDHRNVIISKSQIKQVLKHLDYTKDMPVRSISCACGFAFLFALRTGMRAGEICGLTWANVKDDYCILPVTKTTPRNVPLSKKSKLILERMKGFDKDYVFGIKANTLDAMFRRARNRAKLEGFTFHDARHTAATWMVNSGKVNVLELCLIFGWSSTSMALTYYNPRVSDLSKKLD
jgi:integrase